MTGTTPHAKLADLIEELAKNQLTCVLHLSTNEKLQGKLSFNKGDFVEVGQAGKHPWYVSLSHIVYVQPTGT